MKKISILIILIASFGFLASCEKQDPFVDRVVSPVLVLVESADGVPSSGLTTDPTVSASFSTKASLGIKVLSLDKTNILDYTKGIDSLPVSSLEIKLKIRDGAEVGSFTTDADGLAKIEIDWSSIGISEAGKSVSMAATGTYNDQSFTKLFKISSK
ncbi:hypothetical protein SAMN06298216_1875 [Spirosomataceae bacterium TFI 002]|nr:hypothetical protein SAMN06298216_1875 [Spirosomataceae bacterium TFI 002]